MKNSKILHLGSGRNKLISSNDEVIGVDKIDLFSVDVVHDLENTPWPFKDDEFDKVYASHVIEHLHDTLPVMEEICRIVKNNGIVDIKVPHFSSPNAFGDPTHKSYFSLVSFDYFTKECDLNFYSDARFEILEKKINIDIPHAKQLNKALNKIFNRGRAKYFFETFLSRIFPIKEIIFKLKVINQRSKKR